MDRAGVRAVEPDARSDGVYLHRHCRGSPSLGYPAGDLPDYVRRDLQLVLAASRVALQSILPGGDPLPDVDACRGGTAAACGDGCHTSGCVFRTGPPVPWLPGGRSTLAD